MLTLFRPFLLVFLPPVETPRPEELFRDTAILAADVHGSEEFDKSG